MDMADQRSSKSAAAALFGSTVRPFNNVVPESAMPSVQGECDRMVTAVAATASRATATNPVIVRCFVIRTSWSPKASLEWVTGISRRFNSDATSNEARKMQANKAVPNCRRLLTRLVNFSALSAAAITMSAQPPCTPLRPSLHRDVRVRTLRLVLEDNYREAS